jgi:hypothetical protein
MLIRTTRRDGWLGGQQVVDEPRFILPLTGDPKMSYTHRDEELHISSASV